MERNRIGAGRREKGEREKRVGERTQITNYKYQTKPKEIILKFQNRQLKHEDEGVLHLSSNPDEGRLHLT